MSPLEIILFVFGALVVVYLIMLAVGEPKYTWRSVATLDEIVQEMQRSVDNLIRSIGLKLLPAIEDAIKSFDEFSKAAEKFKSDDDDQLIHPDDN